MGVYIMTIVNLIKNSQFNLLVALLVVALLAAPIITPPLQAKERSYYIYEDVSTGTRFKEKLFKSPIPVNKSYSKLKPKHQAWVRAHYDNMPENDTPPFPAKGYESIVKPLLTAYMQASRQGKVKAVAMIGEDGKTKKVDVHSPNNKEMAEFIAAVIYNTKFDAGTCNGEPCVMEYLLDIDVTTKGKNDFLK